MHFIGAGQCNVVLTVPASFLQEVDSHGTFPTGHPLFVSSVFCSSSEAKQDSDAKTRQGWTLQDSMTDWQACKGTKKEDMRNHRFVFTFPLSSGSFLSWTPPFGVDVCRGGDGKRKRVESWYVARLHKQLLRPQESETCLRELQAYTGTHQEVFLFSSPLSSSSCVPPLQERPTLGTSAVAAVAAAAAGGCRGSQNGPDWIKELIRVIEETSNERIPFKDALLFAFQTRIRNHVRSTTEAEEEESSAGVVCGRVPYEAGVPLLLVPHFLIDPRTLWRGVLSAFFSSFSPSPCFRVPQGLVEFLQGKKRKEIENDENEEKKEGGMVVVELKPKSVWRRPRVVGIGLGRIFPSLPKGGVAMTHQTPPPPPHHHETAATLRDATREKGKGKRLKEEEDEEEERDGGVWFRQPPIFLHPSKLHTCIFSRMACWKREKKHKKTQEKENDATKVSCHGSPPLHYHDHMTPEEEDAHLSAPAGPDGTVQEEEQSEKNEKERQDVNPLGLESSPPPHTLLRSNPLCGSMKDVPMEETCDASREEDARGNGRSGMPEGSDDGGSLTSARLSPPYAASSSSPRPLSSSFSSSSSCGARTVYCPNWLFRPDRSTREGLRRLRNDREGITLFRVFREIPSDGASSCTSIPTTCTGLPKKTDGAVGWISQEEEEVLAWALDSSGVWEKLEGLQWYGGNPKVEPTLPSTFLSSKPEKDLKKEEKEESTHGRAAAQKEKDQNEDQERDSPSSPLPPSTWSGWGSLRLWSPTRPTTKEGAQDKEGTRTKKKKRARSEMEKEEEEPTECSSRVDTAVAAAAFTEVLDIELLYPWWVWSQRRREKIKKKGSEKDFTTDIVGKLEKEEEEEEPLAGQKMASTKEEEIPWRKTTALEEEEEEEEVFWIVQEESGMENEEEGAEEGNPIRKRKGTLPSSSMAPFPSPPLTTSSTSFLSSSFHCQCDTPFSTLFSNEVASTASSGAPPRRPVRSILRCLPPPFSLETCVEKFYTAITARDVSVMVSLGRVPTGTSSWFTACEGGGGDVDGAMEAFQQPHCHHHREDEKEVVVDTTQKQREAQGRVRVEGDTMGTREEKPEAPPSRGQEDEEKDGGSLQRVPCDGAVHRTRHQTNKDLFSTLFPLPLPLFLSLLSKVCGGCFLYRSKDGVTFGGKASTLSSCVVSSSDERKSHGERGAEWCARVGIVDVDDKHRNSLAFYYEKDRHCLAAWRLSAIDATTTKKEKEKDAKLEGREGVLAPPDAPESVVDRWCRTYYW